MTEHKFTDDEIIRALRKLQEMSEFTPPICHYEKDITEPPFCKPFEQFQNDVKVALDLIKRYKAEIERLGNLLDCYEETSGNKKAKAEAIKEFAERLIAKHRRITDYDEAGFNCQIFIVEEAYIDNLVKEMTEGES
jgi:hypothetical protein